jgi:hypothetical protein
MRIATVQSVRDAGFTVTSISGGDCSCGHDSGGHILVAMFSTPFDGGMMYCQNYPDCRCSTTWDTTAPEEIKARHREKDAG